MEWRYVYSRSEILDIRAMCINKHTPIILDIAFQNFLNNYECHHCSIPNTPDHFQQYNNNNTNKYIKNKHNNAPMPEIWRTQPKSAFYSPEPTHAIANTPDFQKFLNTQWQPKKLTPFENKLCNLRMIINKWSTVNFIVCREEFRKWWDDAHELGSWKCYFVIQEWFSKINCENTSNIKWNLEFFLFVIHSINWPVADDAQIQSNLKNDISNITISTGGKNNILNTWIQDIINIDRHDNDSGWISEDYWKFWFTRALEVKVSELVKTNENLEIWCSLIGLFWWNQLLPAQFLQWSFLYPARNISEIEAWTWRSVLWEQFHVNKNERTSSRCNSWQKWVELFFKMSVKVVDFHPNTWPLYLKFKWIDRYPEWKEVIAVENLGASPKIYIPIQ